MKYAPKRTILDVNHGQMPTNCEEMFRKDVLLKSLMEPYGWKYLHFDAFLALIPIERCTFWNRIADLNLGQPYYEVLKCPIKLSFLLKTSYGRLFRSYDLV